VFSSPIAMKQTTSTISVNCFFSNLMNILQISKTLQPRTPWMPVVPYLRSPLAWRS